MQNASTHSVGMKILSILLGALVGGFMFRCRGESGFGSSWGLYSVGLMLTLLLWHFYGDRSKMKFELIPIGALMTGAGVTGYATVLAQMSGMMESDLPYNGSTDSVFVPIDKFSGLWIVLLMGFTLAPLFAFFVGSLFSEKEYKIYHYAIAVAIYYGVSNLMKVTVSPYILQFINPDQVAYAAKGLAYSGIDLTPVKAYLTHFLQRSWTQEIPFFENYYMSIEHVSDSIAAIAVFLYPRIAFKDKVTGTSAFLLNLFISISATLCTSFLTVCYDTGFLANVPKPNWLEGSSGWGLWEYSTGFAIGLFTMLVAAFMPKRLTQSSAGSEKSMFKNKSIRFVYNLLAVTFIFGVVPLRVLCIRTSKLLYHLNILENGSTPGEIVSAVLSVFAAIGFFLLFKKNILSRDGTAFPLSPRRFAWIAFPAYMVFCFLCYFFLNHAELVFMPYDKIHDFSTFVDVFFNAWFITVPVMLITWFLFMALYFPLHKHLKKEVAE